MIQTIKDMLRACILENGGSFKNHLPLIEFAYNNGYHAIIGKTQYKVLYSRKCRSPPCWFKVGDKGLFGLEITYETIENIKMILEKIRKAQDNQNSYTDKQRRPLELQEGDHVFLKVTPRLRLKG